MHKNCTVCIAVQLSIYSLHSDLCGMFLGRQYYHYYFALSLYFGKKGALTFLIGNGATR